MSLIAWPFQVSGSSLRYAAALTLSVSFCPLLAARKLARPFSPASPTPKPLAENSVRCDRPSQTYERPSRMPSTHFSKSRGSRLDDELTDPGTPRRAFPTDGLPSFT